MQFSQLERILPIMEYATKETIVVLNLVSEMVNNSTPQPVQLTSLIGYHHSLFMSLLSQIIRGESLKVSDGKLDKMPMCLVPKTIVTEALKEVTMY